MALLGRRDGAELHMGLICPDPLALGGPLWTYDSLPLSTCPNSSVPLRSSHGGGRDPLQMPGPKGGK